MGRKITESHLHPIISSVCTINIMCDWWRWPRSLAELGLSSGPFINLFNYLNISIWTHGYLFYTLGCNPILLYFVVQIVLALATGNCMVYIFPFFLPLPFSMHVQQTFIEHLLCALPCANHIGSACSLVYKGREWRGRMKLKVRQSYRIWILAFF